MLHHISRLTTNNSLRLRGCTYKRHVHYKAPLVNTISVKRDVLHLQNKLFNDDKERNAALNKLVRKVLKTKKLNSMVQLIYSCSQAYLVINEKHFADFNRLLTYYPKSVSEYSLARLLYGLRLQNGDSPHVRQYVAMLSSIIDKNQIHMTSPIRISMSLYGMKGMSSDIYAVRTMLQQVCHFNLFHFIESDSKSTPNLVL